MMEAITRIYGRLAEGAKDAEIIEEMGISADDYVALKTSMFDTKADEIRTRPIEHVYIDYLLKQSENVKDLTDMIKEFKTTKQYTALVGAVRARSDIYDKLISVGQDCGLIHRQPKRKEIMAGVVVADLTNLQLKKMITKELGDLNALMSRYGERSIMEIDAGEIYHGKAESSVVLDDEDDERDLDVPAILSSALPSHKPKFKSERDRRGARRAGRKVMKE